MNIVQHSLTEGEKAKVNNGILEETREQTLTEFTKWTESIRLNARHKVFMCNYLKNTFQIISHYLHVA